MLMAMREVEVGEEGGFVFLALTVLLLSVISNFFPQNKEGGPGPCSGKFYFWSCEHGRFRSVPKSRQYDGSKDLLSFHSVHHNLFPKTINTALKGCLSTHILW